MIKRSIPFLAILVLLLAACSAAANPAALEGKSVADSAAPSVAQPQLQSMEAARSAVTNPYGEGGANQTSGTTTDATSTSASDTRLVIKNAELSLVVVDPVKSMDAIASLADQLGGYVVTSNAYKNHLSSGEEVPAANITIRVPAAKLNDALTTIKKQVKDATTDILTENVSGQDVTKDYTDLQSRLTNLQQAEAQLREIMASATKPEDVLNIFNQLTQVREQIEVIQGQIKYYEESAAMSSISTQLTAEASVQPLTVAGWQPVGVARDAVQTLINGLQVVGNIGIWFVLFGLPMLLVVALPFVILFLIIRAIRARRKAPRAAPPPAPTASA